MEIFQILSDFLIFLELFLFKFVLNYFFFIFCDLKKKVTKVTTEHKKLPKIRKKNHKSPFLAKRAKKPLPEAGARSKPA